MKRTETKKFTFIELLIVCSVSLLLLGVLLPVLHGADQAAEKKNCADNLKQVTAAALQYAQDNADTLCPIQSYVMVNNQQKFTGTLWTKLLSKYLKDPLLEKGYRTPDGVLTCPEFGTRKPMKGYANKTMFDLGRPDYGMNSYGPGQTRGFGTQIEKLSKVDEPEDMIYFGDSVSKDFGGINGSLTILAHGYVGFRHADKANFGFIDGHVEAKTAKEVHYKEADAAKRLPWSQLWH